MEQAKAIREVQERARKERAERRDQEERARAALEWERDREAREKRLEEEHRQRWANIVKAVKDCDQTTAMELLSELRKPKKLLRAPVERGGSTLLQMATVRFLDKVVDEILKLDKKNIAYANEEGQTALHSAAAVDSSGRILGMLIGSCEPKELSRRDLHGRTPLQVARLWALPEAAQALLASKPAQDQRLPVDDSSSNPSERPLEVTEVGIGHLAALAAVRQGRYQDALQLILETRWIFVNTKDENKRSLLHNAAAWGRPELCYALLDREDFDCAEDADKDEATALHIAAAGEQAECCRAIVLGGEGRFDAVNSLDLRRRTALHLAALRGSRECYEAILLHPDCDTYLSDWYGKTAQEYALERGIDVELPPTATNDIDL